MSARVPECQNAKTFRPIYDRFYLFSILNQVGLLPHQPRSPLPPLLSYHTMKFAAFSVIASAALAVAQTTAPAAMTMNTPCVVLLLGPLLTLTCRR